jgi:cytoskeletal protein CcmA (bactofilin family)
MALFVKDDKTPKSDVTPSTPSLAPSAAAAAPGARDVQAHLGQGSRVEGKLTFEGSVRIDGQVEGEIHAQDTVVIGDHADVSASIIASTVILQGRVKGDVTARKRVELRAPAKLIGNINTPALVVHEGVLFEGNCSMGAAEGRTERSDKRIALFPGEERGAAARRSSEAAN